MHAVDQQPKQTCSCPNNNGLIGQDRPLLPQSTRVRVNIAPSASGGTVLGSIGDLTRLGSTLRGRSGALRAVPGGVQTSL